jgi:predicted nuclease with TOPRIM domain
VNKCKLHKVKNELENAQLRLALKEIDGILKDGEIRRLKEENKKLKENCKENGL